MGLIFEGQLPLPLDIVYDILLRLPVKTLSRLRCVSKSWSSLISDSHFHKDHACRSQLNPLFLLISESVDQSHVTFTTYTIQGSFLRSFSSIRFPIPRILVTDRFEIVQSYMGLICLTVTFDSSTIVCNPSTEEMITLPKGMGARRSVGFGYAASTDEFKVVRYFTSVPGAQGEMEECQCEVFTLGKSDGRWRGARSPPPYMPLFSYAPFFHGALHLMPHHHPQAPDVNYIAAFDLDTEEYRGIPLPEIYYNEAMLGLETFSMELKELSGSICLTIDFSDTKKTLELWFLKDYHGGKWVKQYNIDLTSKVRICVSPSAIMSDRSILLYFSIDYALSELWCYNTQDNHFVEKKGVNCDARHYFESFFFFGK